jgi:ABC-2 type transport system permease protein
MTARLFWQVFSIECRKLMSYRADFWINSVVGFVAHFGVMYYLWRAIFSGPAERIGGYTFEGMLLYYLLVILIGKLVRGAEHTHDISVDIYEGTLSRYIVYPTSYFGFKYAQHLGLMLPGLVQLALFGLLYLLILPVPAEATVTPGSVAMAAVSILIANLMYYTLAAPLQAVAFWADNVWSLVVMQRFATALLGGAMLPLSLFPAWSRPVLDALPFRYLYDFPVGTLIGRIGPRAWLIGVAVSLAWWLAMAGVTRIVWRRGMLSYTGVGI